MNDRFYGVDFAARAGLAPSEYQTLMRDLAQNKTGRMQIKFRCPHCGANSQVRTSRELSPLLREVYFQCANVVCGHTFKANVEVVKTLSPSSFPNPAVSAQLDATGRRDSTQIEPTPAQRQFMVNAEYQARVAAAQEELGTTQRDARIQE